MNTPTVAFVNKNNREMPYAVSLELSRSNWKIRADYYRTAAEICNRTIDMFTLSYIISKEHLDCPYPPFLKALQSLFTSIDNNLRSDADHESVDDYLNDGGLSQQMRVRLERLKQQMSLLDEQIALLPPLPKIAENTHRVPAPAHSFYLPKSHQFAG